MSEANEKPERARHDSQASPVRSPVLPELVSYIEGLPEPHILFDANYRILAANEAYRSQFSPANSVIGRTCYEVSHHFNVPCDQAGESCPLARSRESGQRERVLHLHHTPKGEEYVNIELVPLRDEQGRQRYFIERMEPLQVAQGMASAEGLIGRSASFQAMLQAVARVGPTTASVLLLGESGTGKELVARAVHEASLRSHRPLVVADCASLPETLFESEVFGHEKGAFTGASTTRAGLVEAASGGTLFLDEVGDIPLSMQVKLLRLLESGTYRRVGSTELRRSDVRIVSATHRDLAVMVAEGHFREDLYFRLNVFPIHLPALRDRREDIPILAESLLSRLAAKRKISISDEALQQLAQHDYPGNIRELRNVIERALLLSDGERVEMTAVNQALSMGTRPAAHAQLRVQSHAGAAGQAAPASLPRLKRNPQAQRDALQAALAQHQGDRRALADALGISLRTLYRRLGEL